MGEKQRRDQEGQDDQPAERGREGEARDDDAGGEREQDRAEKRRADAQPPHHAFPGGSLALKSSRSVGHGGSVGLRGRGGGVGGLSVLAERLCDERH